MDANGPGKPIAQLAQAEGIPVKELITHHDKIANSAEAQNHCRAGRLYVPNASEWVDDYLGELTVWTGHPWDVDDQVDVTSNACREFTALAGNQFRDMTFNSHVTQVPMVQTHHGQILFENDAFFGEQTRGIY
jgi:phage terminase large subunit-like protein